MDILMKTDIGNLLCLQHSEQVRWLIIDNLIPFKETLLCPQCFEQKNNKFTTIISLSEVRKQIEESQANNNDKGQNKQFLDELRSFSRSITEFKEKTIKQSETIIEILSQWMRDLQITNNPKDFQEELFDLYQKNYIQAKQIESIESIKQAQITYIQTSFAKLYCLEELNKCNEKLKSILSHIQSKGAEIKTRKRTNFEQAMAGICLPKQLQHINTIQQIQECHAIAFNKDGNLMAAGCDKKYNIILIGHSLGISCLIFSKQINYFFSGSEDKTIRAWKKQNNNWISSSPQSQHTKYINCLLLTKNENELISCSGDRTIKIWKVDCQNIKYDYQLDLIHKGVVNCISLNISQTALVSCSCDDTIILWIRGKTKNGYIHIIFQQLLDSEFVLLMIHKYYSNLCKKMRPMLLKLKTINQQINQIKKLIYYLLFNSKRQIIIQRQNNYVYIIQRQLDGNFKILLQPIDCCSLCNYGSLTEDGQYLVIWNYSTKEFRVHEILY